MDGATDTIEEGIAQEEVALEGPLEVPLELSLEASGEIQPAATPEPLPLAELLAATAGLVVLGAAVGLGTGDAALALRVGPSFAGPIVGALVLTTPGLAVAHQFLDVQSPLAQLVDGVARGLQAAGVLAWGLAPFAAYLSATAPGCWPALIGLLGASAGAVALVVAGARVTRDVPHLVAQQLTWRAAVTGWILLTAAIGVRLAALGWEA